MSEYPDNTLKDANPIFTINRKKIRIKSTDPRNNAMNSYVGDTYIIDDNNVIPTIPSQDFEDIATLTINDLQETLPEIQNLSSTGTAILSFPENLSIDQNSFRIESSDSVSGDGNVYFTATLNFDDVLGSTGYEYIINASD